MIQRCIHMFHVVDKFVEVFLVLDIFCLWFISPVNSGGIWISLSSIFPFYQVIFKLLTNKFSSSVIRDFHWPWIPDQPRSFYQVFYRHRFIVAVLSYFKPPGYRVYHCNGF